MSEYQYIAFRAIDGPVGKSNLAFMRDQSSRAEVTAWSFENEYHYGDFGGEAEEMLRRGYDFHLHFSNFGDRKVMIRLPNGLQDAKAADVYFDTDGLEYIEDKDGPGGILLMSPYFEPGHLDDPEDLAALVDGLLPLRAEILNGDLRPLYLARLGVGLDANHGDDEAKDAPVPAGLEKLTDAQNALAEFYGLSVALTGAAAIGSPPLPENSGSAQQDYGAWLCQQPESTRNAWLAQLMADPEAGVRSVILAAYQKSHKKPSWPIALVSRTLADLLAAEEINQQNEDRESAEVAARQRAKKLANLAADPTVVQREAERLLKIHGSEKYNKVADLLVELREALAGSSQSNLAEFYALDLKNKNPTMTKLMKALKAKGFLKK